MMSEFSIGRLMRFFCALFLAVTVFAISTVVVLPNSSSEAQATQGFPMYSWGVNMLGRPTSPVPPYTPANLPGRVAGPTNWIFVSTASGGNYAINTNNELFAWGVSWDAYRMGQGGVNPGVGSTLTSPTQIGTDTNWVMTASRFNNVAAINSDGEVFVWGEGGPYPAPVNVPTRIDEAPDNIVFLAAGNTNYFVITDEGFMYSWGYSGGATVARDTTDVPHDVPGRVIVAGREDLRWKTVTTTGSNGLAVTRCGELFSWGGGGSIGRPTSGAGATPGGFPGAVIVYGETAPRNNWVDVIIASNHVAALNSDGEIYTWGHTDGLNPQIFGRPAGVAHPNNAPFNRPGILVHNVSGTYVPFPPGKFVSLHGGNGHFLAFTNTDELWAWGNNSAGQLGVGGNNEHKYRPTHVAYIARFSDAAVGGSARSIMLIEIRTIQTEMPLYKHLQKPESTPTPNLNFRFTFERNSFNGNSTAADINRIPVLDPVIINPTTLVNPNDPDPAPEGIITLEGYADFLDGVVFEESGVFSWIIREDATHPSGAGANSSVVFSQAEYELRVDIRQEGGMGGDLYIYAITLHRLRSAEGVPIIPPIRVDDLIFTNTYIRTTTGTATCPGALSITKTVEGSMADPATVFNFDITLTGTALCATDASFTARVYNANDTFNRNEVFTTGTSRHVTLLDGQYIVFPELPVGVSWVATERAINDFTAALELTVNGTVHPRVTNATPNEELSTGTNTIGQATVNNADFFNIYFSSPPMGLVIGVGTAPLIFIGAAATVLTALVALNSRRRLEDIPTMY